MAVTPRSDYRDVRSRAEFTVPCVYVLTGPPEGDGVLPRIYVGEGDQARSRLDSHLIEKDFWTEAIVLTASDGSLNKAITRYMEARLVELAQAARRAELDNGNAPQLPPLSEADAADAEAFLAEARSIFPVLRVDAFELPTETPSTHARLSLSGPGASAVGSETSEGFVVYAESVARATTVPSIHAYLVQLRSQLLGRGILAEEEDGLRLTQDYVFNSPSTAAGGLPRSLGQR